MDVYVCETGPYDEHRAQEPWGGSQGRGVEDAFRCRDFATPPLTVRLAVKTPEHASVTRQTPAQKKAWAETFSVIQ